jgi:hypothetical protein
MTQKRYYNPEHDLTSWDFISSLIGFREPGRYRGFDTLGVITPLLFYLGHDINKSAFKPVKKDGTLEPNTHGLSISPQGVVIVEDTIIGNFTISANSQNNPVVYGVYLEHQYVESTIGGSEASYGIIYGGNGGNKPTVTNPLTQVMLGFLTIPKRSTVNSDLTTNGVVWEPIRPTIAGKVPMLLDEPNYINAALHEKVSSTRITTQPGLIPVTPITPLVGLEINDNGNVVEVDASTTIFFHAIRKKRLGARIKLQNITNNPISIEVGISDMTAGIYNEGWRLPLWDFNHSGSSDDNIVIPGYEWIEFQLVNTGLPSYPERWVVINTSRRDNLVKELETRVSNLEIGNTNWIPVTLAPGADFAGIIASLHLSYIKDGPEMIFRGRIRRTGTPDVAGSLQVASINSALAPPIQAIFQFPNSLQESLRIEPDGTIWIDQSAVLSLPRVNQVFDFRYRLG